MKKLRNFVVYLVDLTIDHLKSIKYQVSVKPDTSWKDNPSYSEPFDDFILNPIQNWHRHICKRCGTSGAPHRVLDLEKFYYTEFHAPQCKYCDRKDACISKKSFFNK